MRTSFCSKCGLTIGWCFTENGRQMPLDPQPNEAGNVIVAFHDHKLIGHVLSKRDVVRPEGVAYVPHYATCAGIDRPPPKLRNPAKPSPPAPVPLDLFNQGDNP